MLKDIDGMYYYFQSLCLVKCDPTDVGNIFMLII